MDDMTFTHDDHDDGLVHGHSWATEPPPAVASSAPASLASVGKVVPAREDGHDEGLVHDHGWACRERGAEAHA